MGDIGQLSLLAAEFHPDAFVVRESARARRMSITVHPVAGVEVVVPRRTRPATVEAFVRANSKWIARATHEFAAVRGPVDMALPVAIELGAVDARRRVSYERDDARKVLLRDDGRTLSLRGRVDEETVCLNALRRWLGAQGRKQLVPWLRQVSAETGLAFGKVQIRGQRTRWGSCSHLKTISLNYCLLFLDPACVRYLLVHELCHTRHLNHSRAYWALVERHEPARRELEARLDTAWKDVPGWALRC